MNHAACKIIENLLIVADKQADKLATADIALALWNISSTAGNNEHLRASALAVNRCYRFRIKVLVDCSLGLMSYGFIVSRCCTISY